EWNHPEIVKLLLADPRVDPSGDNNAAIRYASHNNNYEIFELLINNSNVINKLYDMEFNHLIKEKIQKLNLDFEFLLKLPEYYRSKMSNSEEKLVSQLI